MTYFTTPALSVYIPELRDLDRTRVATELLLTISSREKVSVIPDSVTKELTVQI